LYALLYPITHPDKKDINATMNNITIEIIAVIIFQIYKKIFEFYNLF
tara:strand:- start:186 stop:326 length:141 start_codon:yes stop_codon:yes gene_type:complete